MRQRAALLRTFLAGHDVMLLDEPFGALDALTREELQEWLLRIWQEDRKTILFVTHDVEEALFLSDRVHVMSGRPGRIELSVDVGLERPRERGPTTADPRFAELKAELIGPLRRGAEAACMRADGKRGLSLDSPAMRIVAPAAFAVVVLALWQLYTVVSDVPESSLPSPTEIARAGWEHRDLLIDNTWVTVEEILIGFALAIVLGVVLAILVRSSKTVERAVYPWLVVSQMVPVPAVAPIFVIWTGFDLRPKVMVMALVAFFPIAVNSIDGLRAADPQLLRLMRTLRASRWQQFRYAQASRRPAVPVQRPQGCGGTGGDRRRVRRVGRVLRRPRAPDPGPQQRDRDGDDVRDDLRAVGDRHRPLRARDPPRAPAASLVLRRPGCERRRERTGGRRGRDRRASLRRQRTITVVPIRAKS